MHAETMTLDAPSVARALEGRPGLVWLDGDGRDERGRHSFLASDPVETVEVRWGQAAPLAALARLDAASVADDPFGFVPRWAGYVAYDAAFSASAAARHARADERVLYFARFDAWVVIDHLTGEATLVGDDEAAVSRLKARLARRPPRLPAHASELRSEDAALHREAVERALEAIAAGEIYQVNLARRFEADFEGSSLALFEAMRSSSPVPYGLFLDDGERAVLGRSMERFLGWKHATRRLETRPIKGTIASHGDRAREAQDLRTDPKEHAEHVMVVDLMRNDLGRVAVPGSVRVERPFEVEPYARLSHLVSTIGCVTRERLGLVELLEATFPPGSVTGTPKSRAMKLIEALERGPRGVYCGAYGTVSRTGDLSLAVAIRTATVANGRLAYHAGGGIVSASDPVRETEETVLKTAVLRDALARLREPL